MPGVRIATGHADAASKDDDLAVEHAATALARAEQASALHCRRHPSCFIAQAPHLRRFDASALIARVSSAASLICVSACNSSSATDKMTSRTLRRACKQSRLKRGGA